MSDKRRPMGDSRWARVLTLLPLLGLTACSWFTDFKQQPKIDPWETPNDSTPFRGNPQMSVPIYGTAAPGFIYDRSGMPQTIATMAAIPNPVPADSASIGRGRVQFQINCAVCHGPLGMGNGPAVKYGMAGIAIGAGSNAANTLSDGYIFGMIRNGRGLMPPYNRIEEPDRWDIVNYLRTIQGKNTAIAADTSHCRPGETGLCAPGASRMGPTRPVPYYRASASNGMSNGVSGPTGPTGPVMPAGGDTLHRPTADTAKKAPTDTTKKPEPRP